MEDDASRSVVDKIHQRQHSYKCQYSWFYKNNFNKKMFKDDAFTSVIVNIIQLWHFLKHHWKHW